MMSLRMSSSRWVLPSFQVCRTPQTFSMCKTSMPELTRSYGAGLLQEYLFASAISLAVNVADLLARLTQADFERLAQHAQDRFALLGGSHLVAAPLKFRKQRLQEPKNARKNFL